MTKAYLVFEGRYSDRRVQGVFDCRDLAEEFRQRFCTQSESAVEEYDVNPYEQGIREGWHKWVVVLRRDGDLDTIRHGDEWWSAYGGGYWARYADGERFVSDVLARDGEHAVKVANERRAISIANGEMPNER